jgi:HEAT repeat protein
MPTILPAPQEISKKNIKEWNAALNYFIQQLQSDDIDIKFKAIKNLGDMGDPKAIDPLKQVMKDDDERIRVHAEEAINKIFQINK